MELANHFRKNHLYMAFQRLDPDELEELRLKYLPMVSLTGNKKRNKGKSARVLSTF
jgi:hypothetical protein